MLCEPTDAYDLVILVLFLISDNDCCCVCVCTNIKITLCAVRFLIHYFVTLGQIVIILVTNESTSNVIDSMTPTSKSLYHAAVVMFSIFGFIACMFVFLACLIRCDGLNGHFFGTRACPTHRSMVFPLLILSCTMMLTMDIFMFIFTTVYGKQQGEQVIDFSSFGDGFRSCMFLVSIFDIVHASVSILIVILSRNNVLAKILPGESTGTYLERERYKLDL